MESIKTDKEISKRIIEKIETELQVLKLFNELNQDKEENTDFLIFCNQTAVGNKIKEEINQMNKVVLDIYNKTHDLNQHTTRYLDNSPQDTNTPNFT